MICPSCGEGLDPAITRMGLSLHPTCEAVDTDPNEVAMEMFGAIKDAIVNQPRSLQTRIGPSEIGTPCDRRLAFKIAGAKEINATAGNVAWKPYVGTCIHEALADIMAKHEIARFSADEHAVPRWHIEESVSVGEIGGVEITGSTDAFDAHHGIVVDWKTTSVNQIRRNYAVKGPGNQYRVQAHLYGRGWQRAGHSVKHVMVIWLVRDGAFTDRHVFTEPYDEQIAIDALDRAQGIWSVIDALGPEQAIPLFDKTDSYCQNCPFYRTGWNDDATGCSGVASDTGPRTDVFSELLGG